VPPSVEPLRQAREQQRRRDSEAQQHFQEQDGSEQGDAPAVRSVGERGASAEAAAPQLRGVRGGGHQHHPRSDDDDPAHGSDPGWNLLLPAERMDGEGMEGELQEHQEAGAQRRSEELVAVAPLYEPQVASSVGGKEYRHVDHRGCPREDVKDERKRRSVAAWRRCTDFRFARQRHTADRSTPRGPSSANADPQPRRSAGYLPWAGLSKEGRLCAMSRCGICR
jgi:hypothetical protein